MGISAEVKAGSFFGVRNPATGEILTSIRSMRLPEVKEMIDRAYEALPVLQGLSIAKRSRLLLETAALIRADSESLVETMTDEIGRPIKSAGGEIQRTAQIFELAGAEVRHVFEGEFVPLESYEYPSGNERRIAFVKREPCGVVGAITPFNFPAASFAHKVAPALAVGNTVVHKPTVLAPLTQMALAKIIEKAGFPQGSVNVATGSSAMIGEEFVSNAKVSLISFTGSEKVGLEIAGRAVANAKRVIMELGGSDAEIVLEDADLQAAAVAAAVGRFDYAGQFCNATKRLIVRREVSKAFTEALVAKIRAMKVGDPRDEDTDVGPLISKEAVDSMKGLLDDAVNSGAELIYRGRAPERGYYFAPVVLRTSKPIRVTSEEVFGPIFPVMVAASDEEAVETANSTPYGLDASIFTKDFGRAYTLAGKLKAGSVIINDMTRLRWDNLPFGGVRRSGIGRESVRDTMREMTEIKVISYNIG
jgi:succinyl-CoA reductase